MDKDSKFFLNKHDRIFTVRLLWNIGQPIVFGTLEEVIKYALKPNNGIEGFYELEGKKMRKVSKKELKEFMQNEDLRPLLEQLFTIY